MNTETRKHITVNAELRASGDAKTRVIEGYAATFDSLSTDLGGFREKLEPGCFSAVLATNPDVRMLINHDSNAVLGRTKSGTLKIAQDSRGLRFRCELPDTQAARDIYESIKRGDVSQCSFAFRCGEDKWEENAAGITRTVTTVAELMDVSAVTYPAYEETSVDARARKTTTDADKVWQEHAELALQLAAVDLNS